MTDRLNRRLRQFEQPMYETQDSATAADVDQLHGESDESYQQPIGKHYYHHRYHHHHHHPYHHRHYGLHLPGIHIGDKDYPSDHSGGDPYSSNQRLAHRDGYNENGVPNDMVMNRGGAGDYARHNEMNHDGGAAYLGAGDEMMFSHPNGGGYVDDDGINPEGGLVALAPVPVVYDKSPHRFIFKKVFSLASLKGNLRTKDGIVVDLRKLYAKNKHAQSLFASGAVLGDVWVNNLVANGAHVSLTVRAESHGNKERGYNAINLKAPKHHSPDVEQPFHGILNKENKAPISIQLRSASPVVAKTFLSQYKDYNVSNLHKNVKSALKKGMDEVSTDHPVVQFLESQGYFEDGELANMETVHIPTQDRVGAQRCLEEQELANPKVGDAQSIRLVIGMGFGRPTGGGAPTWGDTTEIGDDILGAQRDQIIKVRQNSPICLTGEFVIGHGYTVPDPFDDDDGDADDVDNGGDGVDDTIPLEVGAEMEDHNGMGPM